MTEKSKESKKLPAKVGEIPQELALVVKDLKDEIRDLTEHKSQEVSSEFKALMDGYVSKANESEGFKVKYEHIVGNQEELKVEIKEVKENNKRITSDLEATREALRHSEADLKASQNQASYAAKDYQEQIANLSQDKSTLKEKLQKLEELKDAAAHQSEVKIAELNKEIEELRDELLEANHKNKKLEQEVLIDQENFERSLRDSEGLIKELKEQLDLRTREIEYKDALLNQIVRDASNDTLPQPTQAPAHGKVRFSQNKNAQTPISDFQQRKASTSSSPENLDQMLASNPEELENNSSIWGAFRK